MSASEYVRNPALLGYSTELEGRPCVALDVDAGKPSLIVDDPRLLWALGSLPTRFTPGMAHDLWAAKTSCEPVTRELWAFCVENDLVIESSRLAAPDAPFAAYHGATRSYPFMNMSGQGAFAADNALMREYAETDDYPAVYATFPATASYQLVKVEELIDATADTLCRLSLLFDGTFGERFRRDHGFDEEADYLQLELIYKAIPSGGARHPTEAFAFLAVDDLPKGLYHYNVRDNSLDLLEAQPTVAEERQFFSSINFRSVDGCPAISVVLCSHVERAMWRYRDPRSFRAIVIDAGHAQVHLAELARFLGYQAAHAQRPDRMLVSSFVGMDSAEMPVMGVTVITK